MNTFNKFEEFNWHDCPVYSIRFEDELEFDIDYIIESRVLNDSTYKYLIAPTKLVFFHIEKFEINIESDFLNGFEINRIVKIENSFKIELQEGYIKFNSLGFIQKYLKEPRWVNNLYLSFRERRTD